jgi:hypothetical protein
MQRTNVIHPDQRTNAPEPRWPVVVALLATGALYLAMPQALSVGPRWLPFGIVAVLLVPTLITHHLGHVRVNVWLGYLLSATVTLFLLWSLRILVKSVFAHRESPTGLLTSGALLWVTNVLVFATWYWRLDAGGPHERDSRVGHPTGAFLFPQMVTPGVTHRSDKLDARAEPWSPNFVDYLFLAFNTSTAFSPTDTPALTRWAKVLMMVQSLISMATLLILVGRVVNII